jgi:hypothetical protein
MNSTVIWLLKQARHFEGKYRFHVQMEGTLNKKPKAVWKLNEPSFDAGLSKPKISCERATDLLLLVSCLVLFDTENRGDSFFLNNGLSPTYNPEYRILHVINVNRIRLRDCQ